MEFACGLAGVTTAEARRKKREEMRQTFDELPEATVTPAAVASAAGTAHAHDAVVAVPRNTVRSRSASRIINDVMAEEETAAFFAADRIQNVCPPRDQDPYSWTDYRFDFSLMGVGTTLMVCAWCVPAHPIWALCVVGVGTVAVFAPTAYQAGSGLCTTVANRIYYEE